MHVVVIGGSGHIGSYLIPRLVRAGHRVTNVSRGRREPYFGDPAWHSVESVTLDRKTEDESSSFGPKIADLGPDVVMDLICFSAESGRQLAEALTGKVSHLIVCGTIWVHGPSARVPTVEEEPKKPFGDYGIRKAELEAYLLERSRKGGIPATLVHPGHIVGPGWAPVNPAGNFSLEVFERLATGKEVCLPNLGMETVHHVHADDVAQVFFNAMNSWSTAAGESFHAVSEQALTLRGYAKSVAAWSGREANLRFLPWEEWKKTVSDDEARATGDHIHHSPNCSIRKARTLLGYHPRYTSLEAVRESLRWLVDNGRVNIPST